MENKRPVTLDDVIEYQQQNQALLQTILWRLDQTGTPGFEDITLKYTNALEATEKLFNLKLMGNPKSHPGSTTA